MLLGLEEGLFFQTPLESQVTKLPLRLMGTESCKILLLLEGPSFYRFVRSVNKTAVLQKQYVQHYFLQQVIGSQLGTCSNHMHLLCF